MDGKKMKKGESKMSSSSGITQLRAKLKPVYEELTGQYEGYIQMSDRRIEHVFKEQSALPSWETLHDKEVNYILEMALYDPETKQSVLVRQHNDDWLILDKTLSGNEPTQSYFTVTDETLKMNIAQIWEAEENLFCPGLKTLEAKYMLFAGFKKEKK